MSILESILGSSRDAVQGGGNPQTPQWWVKRLFGGGPATLAGVSMDEERALTLSAVWNAVNIISGAVGFLPFLVFRKQGTARHRAPLNPVNRLLKERANPYVDALTFRETLQGWVLLWGNGYAEIERNGAGVPINLWPIPPDKVTAKIIGDNADAGPRRVVYEVRDNGGGRSEIPFEDMFHIKGLSPDALHGYSPVQVGRESLGIAKATENYGGVFFKNNATPPAVLTHPGKLGEPALEHLKESWKENHSGTENQHKLAILEEGMDIKTLGLPPEDAQFLESREFSVVEVARWFDIPPHMIKSMKQATFSNIEHQGLEFVTWTLMKWLRRWESETNLKLFGAVGRMTFFSEFITAALLRGDTKSRFDAYRVAINSGWMNRNEVRSLENLNPVDGLEGYWQPVNVIAVGEEADGELVGTAVPMVEGSSAEEVQATRDETAEAAVAVTDTSELDQSAPVVEEEDLTLRYSELFLSTWTRIVTKEVNALKRVIKRDDARDKVVEFYGRHEEHVADVLTPVMRIFSVGPDAIRKEARRYTEDSRADVISVLEGEGDAMELLTDWSVNKARRMAEEMKRGA